MREGEGDTAAHLVKALGFPPSPAGWAAARCASLTAAEAIGLQSFLEADFVLGFGLPPVLLNMLLDKAIPFLDIEIDAVRFAPDLFLNVSTDDEDLAADFSRMTVTDTAVIPALSALLARERRVAPTRGFFPDARVGLFVGQVPHDAAVIAEGRFVLPAQVLSQIVEIAAELDLLLVRPHPHWNSIDHLLPILDAVPHAILTQHPSYALLADSSVSDVIALSSSLLTEARLAGKRVHQLMIPDRDRPLLREPRLRQARVSWPAFLSVLTRRLQAIPPDAAPIPEPMALHTSLQTTWGLASPPVQEVPELVPAREMNAGAPAFAGALIHGWHRQEDWGVWASQREATLVLRRPAAKTGGTLRLTFMALPQRPGGVQMVEVSTSKGDVSGTTRITNATAWQGTMDLAVPDGAFSAGYLQLRIRSANMTSPADMGMSEDTRALGAGLRSIMFTAEEAEHVASEPQRNGHVLGAAYYTSLHETNSGYQQNNWLVEEADLLAQIPGDILQEVGCGNGRYLEVAAQARRRVIGCDWALSPGVRDLRTRMANIEFFPCDITKHLPQFNADILVSANVLEHLPTQDIAPTLARLTQAGRWQFHKIACYDDAHSHLTVRDPSWWLSQFCAISPSYRLIRLEERSGDPERPICIISNFPFIERGIVKDPLRPGLEQALAAASAERDTASVKAAEMEGLLKEMRAQLADLNVRMLEMEAELQAKTSRLGAIERSTIWRATRPLRRIASRMLGRSGEAT